MALAGTAVLGAVVWALVPRGPRILIPDDPCRHPPALQTYHGVTLQLVAMTGFKEAERMAGRRIAVVASYRSCAKQALACERICHDPKGCPGRCASPGTSYHQLGAAVDVTQAVLDTPKLVRALKDAGWCQPLPKSDPGHFSFDGCH